MRSQAVSAAVSLRRHLTGFRRQEEFALRKMNIQKTHSWRSSSHPRVRGVVIGDRYYRISFVGSPDIWEIEIVAPDSQPETRCFGSRREAQEFLQSLRR